MSEHTPLTGDWALIEAFVCGCKEDDCPRREVVHRVAARTSTATADTGLRERVEALIEAGRDSLGGTNLLWVSDLQDALDATASTEDRADNEGTR